MKQSFSVKMQFDRTTAGGQRLYVTPKDIATDAAARNIYLTKRAFPPGVAPNEVTVSVEYDDGK